MYVCIYIYTFTYYEKIVSILCYLLTFISKILTRVNKTRGLLRKCNLFRPSQITIYYQAFTRSHLNYGNIVFDKAYNNSFHQRLESIQCKVALTINAEILSSTFLCLAYGHKSSIFSRVLKLNLA